MAKKRVIQIYLDDEEYEYLQQRAMQEHRSMAQTLLHMADFQRSRKQQAVENKELPVKLKGINFSDTPLEDYKTY